MGGKQPRSARATGMPVGGGRFRDTEDGFRSIVEDTPLLVCRFLPGCIIEYANPAYCEYFGKTADELVGTSFLMLIPESDRGRALAAVESLSFRHPVQTMEHPVAAPDGDVRWQRWTDRALFDRRKRIVAYQAIGEDITGQKRMEEKIVAASTKEKKNLARDLHDGLAQQLVGTACLCQGLRERMPTVAYRKALDEIASGLRQCLDHVRHIAGGLFPVGLEEAGLGPLLRQLAKRVSAVFKVSCSARITGVPEAMDMNTASHLYFLAQEAAMNAARHGRPRRIAIVLSWGARRLTVRDDGAGFDPKRIEGDSLGLQIMRYRASAIGSVLDLESKKGRGARIACAWGPVRPAPSAVRAAASRRREHHA